MNNRGLSLVELIVAISVGVIVSGAIAALISFSIRMYRNEGADLSAQYELQTNVNQIMDTIMSANCYVIQKVVPADPEAGLDPPGRITEYAAFGTYDGSKFSGVVFLSGKENPAGSDRFRIYMDRGEWDGTTACEAVSDHVDVMETDIYPADPETPPDDEKYLLGLDATMFRIEPKVLTESPKTYVNISSGKYKNPLSVEVELAFEKDATGHEVEKIIKDEALIRNRISTEIYIDGIPYSQDKSR